MSDPSNPFKSLADSLLSDTQSQPAKTTASESAVPDTFDQLLDAFFSAELVRERVEHLQVIRSTHGTKAHDFLFAVAEEDADALIRLAAYIQLHTLGVVDSTDAVAEILRDELEHPVVYPTGLMLLDELPQPAFKAILPGLVSALPDEPFGQCALIQLVRRESPESLDQLLLGCINKVPDGVQGLDDDVWNESLLSLSLVPQQTINTRQRIQQYVDNLPETDARYRDFMSETSRES